MLPKVTEIKRRRKALGLSQAELASKAKISRTSLVKLENEDIDLRYSKVKEIFDTLEYLESSRGPGSSFQGMTLKDIHNQPIEFVSVDDVLIDVSRKMIETTFSQFPVKDGEKILGSITEIGINQSIGVKGKDALDLKIREKIEEPFPVISANAPVPTVIALLRSVQAILTADGGSVVGIVTNTDLYKKLV
jgi:predicted transcriptional regulator